jgi:hypothetical protein
MSMLISDWSQKDRFDLLAGGVRRMGSPIPEVAKRVGIARLRLTLNATGRLAALPVLRFEALRDVQ